MKNFDRLNYYQILKIPQNASFVDINRAYKDAVSIYSEDSLATYSLFPNDERDKILGAIEEAFLTLTDKNKRAAYDKILVDSGNADVSFLSGRSQQKSTPRFHTLKPENDNDLDVNTKNRIRTDSDKKISEEILSKSSLSGDDLKKLRKAAGVKIQDIYSVTKISISVLNAIEENRFDMLPPETYLKNFLRLYAESLHIDPRKIVAAYLKNMSLAQNTD